VECIAHVVCTAQNIQKSRWNLFKETVRDAIRVRRANCTTALKKEYMGEFALIEIIFFIIILSTKLEFSFPVAKLH
jgi:hypothetical protein